MARIRRVDKLEEEAILVAMDRLQHFPEEVQDEFWPPDKKKRTRHKDQGIRAPHHDALPRVMSEEGDLKLCVADPKAVTNAFPECAVVQEFIVATDVDVGVGESPSDHEGGLTSPLIKTSELSVASPMASDVQSPPKNADVQPRCKWSEDLHQNRRTRRPAKDV